MGTKLDRIAETSAQNPKTVFTSLYHLINEDLLRTCHQDMDGRKATGVDNVTKAEYEENLEKNLRSLVARLKRKNYKPQPSLRVYIPKAAGKLRPLGMATVRAYCTNTQSGLRNRYDHPSIPSAAWEIFSNTESPKVSIRKAVFATC